MRNLNKVKDKFYAGARRPPHPPSAERRAANFWHAPQHPAPLSSTPDDRYGL